MEMNVKENVCCDFKFDGEINNNCVDFDDFDSNESWKDIADLLPEDPFGMKFNMEAKIMVPVTCRINDFGTKEGYKFVETDQTYNSKRYWTSSMTYGQKDERGECEIAGVGLQPYLKDRSNDKHNKKLGGGSEDLMYFFGCEKYDVVDANDLRRHFVLCA